MTGEQMTERARRLAHPEAEIGDARRGRSLEGGPGRARSLGLRGIAAIAVLAVGLVAAVPGPRIFTAQAASPSDSGPLTICINHNGIMRALLTGSQCPYGQQQVTLNPQGS